MQQQKENTNKKLTVFLVAVTLLLTFSTVYFASEANRYKRQERLINEKAISSLCESLDSITVTLRKGVYSGDGQALEKTGTELCREAAVAKESLSLLSPEGEFADELYKFLSQVGNYTVALSSGKKQMKREDAEKLGKLCDYSRALSQGLNEICLDYYNGDVTFDGAAEKIGVSDDGPSDFYSRVNDAAQTLGDYPTLTYDGPFADNLAAKKSDFLERKKEITDKEAAEKAADVLGVQTSALKREADIDADLELYCFSKGKTDVTVTKKGGYICTVLCDDFALEETISAAEAVSRGEEYLEKLGYDDMQSSYYSIYDGICTINYVWEKDDVICYSDLIKVSVSLDTGKLAGLDAKPFLLSHRERDFSEAAVSEKEAKAKLSPVLEVIEHEMAVIPLDTGKEALCHEFHCKDAKNQELLVYIDALTGQQRDMLLLLYSDDGILTK